MRAEEEEDDEMLCLICRRIFEEEGERMPRMLPECGHSVCTACISSKLESSEQIVCPEDNEEQNRSSLAEFRKNFSLIRIIQKKKKIEEAEKAQNALQQQQNLQSQQQQQLTLKSRLGSQQEFETDRSLDENTNTRFQTDDSERSSHLSSSIQVFDDRLLCIDHSKKLDIVCVDCRVRICANCALFAKHRGHAVRSEEDVWKEISTRAEYLISLMDTIDREQQVLSDDSNINEFKAMTKQKKADSIRAIQVKEIIEQIEEKKTELIKEVEVKFDSIEEQWVHRISSVSSATLTQTEKWRVEAKEKLEALCDSKIGGTIYGMEQSYSLDLMLDQNRNQKDVIEQGEELIGNFKSTNVSLQAILEESKQDDVTLNFSTPSIRTFISAICEVKRTHELQLNLQQEDQLQSRNQIQEKSHISFMQNGAQNLIQSVEIHSESNNNYNDQAVNGGEITLEGVQKDSTKENHRQNTNNNEDDDNLLDDQNLHNELKGIDNELDDSVLLSRQYDNSSFQTPDLRNLRKILESDGESERREIPQVSLDAVSGGGCDGSGVGDAENQFENGRGRTKEQAVCNKEIEDLIMSRRLSESRLLDGISGEGFVCGEGDIDLLQSLNIAQDTEPFGGAQ